MTRGAVTPDAGTRADIRGPLPAVQYLRAVAALMVVVHHALTSLPRVITPVGYPAFAYGVDVFFVISGFIMVVAASSESAGGFVVRRLVRVVPLYWAATLLLLVKTEKLQVFDLSGGLARHVGLSLAFVPHYSPEHAGEIFPYLVPGWTLSYEMFFYAIFAVGLLWRRPVVTLTVVLPVLVILGWVFQPHDAVLRTLTDERLLTFAAGAWLGVLHRRTQLPTWALVLTPIGFVGLFASPEVAHGEFWVRTVSATLIVAGAVALGGRALPRLGIELGDASYSIYLTHLLLPVPLAGRLALALPVPRTGQAVAAVALSLVLSAAIGWVVYRYAERPVLRYLRRRLTPARPTPVGASAAPGRDQPPRG